MALLNNKNEYTKRMNESMKHKEVILNYLTGKKILDFGCGTGMLASLIQQKNFLGTVHGYDNSLEMIELAQTYGSPEVKFSNVFPTEKYDTIILSAVLHEVFSYENGMKSVEDLIVKLKSLLYTNGKIIIRENFNFEGPGTWEAYFKDQLDGYEFYKTYATFYSWYIPDLILTNKGFKVQGNYSEVMEFLNKYTWGWNSLPREINEKVYFASEKDWNILAGKIGMKATIHEETQSDYFDYLNKKVYNYSKMNTHVIVELT